MEIAGLAVGVVGICGLFTTCTELLNRIKDAQELALDLNCYKVELDACLFVFHKWGERTGVRDPNSVNTSCNSQIALADKETQQLVYEGLAAIEQLLSNLKALERAYGLNIPVQDGNSGLSGVTNTQVEERSASLTKLPTFFSRKSKSRFTWAIRDKQKFPHLIAHLSTLIHRLHEVLPVKDSRDARLDDLERALESLTFQIQKAKVESSGHEGTIVAPLKRMDEFIDDTKKRQMFDWLNAISPRSDFDNFVFNRLPGTCEWVLDREYYQEWKTPSTLRDPMTGSVLWICAGPGCGKSYLSARIIQDLQSSSSFPTMYFYVKDEDGGKRTAASIVRSWVHQLAVHDVHDVHLGFSTLVSEKVPISEKNSTSGKATDRDIWELFSLYLTLSAASPVYFVIDGLDEANFKPSKGHSSSLGERAAFLRELFNRVKGTSARILITSRDRIDLRKQIERADAQEEIYASFAVIEKEDTSADIQSLSELVVQEQLFEEDPSLKTKTADEIAKRSDGMFLWVRMSGNCLSRWKTFEELQDDILQGGGTMEDVYAKEFQRILSLTANDRKRALDILALVLSAQRPLDVYELESLLLIDTERYTIRGKVPNIISLQYIRQRILGICGSFLQHTQHESQWAWHVGPSPEEIELEVEKIHIFGSASVHLRTDGTSVKPAVSNYFITFTHFSAKEYLAENIHHLLPKDLQMDFSLLMAKKTLSLLLSAEIAEFIETFELPNWRKLRFIIYPADVLRMKESLLRKDAFGGPSKAEDIEHTLKIIRPYHSDLAMRLCCMGYIFRHMDEILSEAIFKKEEQLITKKFAEAFFEEKKLKNLKDLCEMIAQCLDRLPSHVELYMMAPSLSMPVTRRAVSLIIRRMGFLACPSVVRQIVLYGDQDSNTCKLSIKLLWTAVFANIYEDSFDGLFTLLQRKFPSYPIAVQNERKLLGYLHACMPQDLSLHKASQLMERIRRVQSSSSLCPINFDGLLIHSVLRGSKRETFDFRVLFKKFKELYGIFNCEPYQYELDWGRTNRQRNYEMRFEAYSLRRPCQAEERFYTISNYDVRNFYLLTWLVLVSCFDADEFRCLLTNLSELCIDCPIYPEVDSEIYANGMFPFSTSRRNFPLRSRDAHDINYFMRLHYRERSIDGVSSQKLVRWSCPGKYKNCRYNDTYNDKHLGLQVEFLPGTPLQRLALVGDKEVIKVFLEFHANPNIRAPILYYLFPPQYALDHLYRLTKFDKIMQARYNEILSDPLASKLKLNYGVFLIFEQGTAAEIARKYGHTEVADILEKAQAEGVSDEEYVARRRERARGRVYPKGHEGHTYCYVDRTESKVEVVTEEVPICMDTDSESPIEPAPKRQKRE